MYRKLIHSISSVFFVFSIGTASPAAEENKPWNGFETIQRTVQEIYSSEKELKRTWSYQGLVTTEIVLESALKYSACGLWGVSFDAAYKLTEHNAPDLLCRAASWLLPQSRQMSFHQFVNDIVLILHVRDCVERPLQQALGYVFGFTGLFFVQQVLDHFALNEECIRESRGFAYYCFRKAGWLTVEHFNDGINFFRDTLPHVMNYLDPLPLNCFAGAVEIKSPANELNKQCPSPQYFSPFQSHPNPICYHIRLNPRDSEVWKAYAPFLHDHSVSLTIKKDEAAYITGYLNREYQRSITEGKVFRVVMNENHVDLSCLKAEKVVMQFMEGKAEFLNLEFGNEPLQTGAQRYQQYRELTEYYREFEKKYEAFNKMTETDKEKCTLCNGTDCIACKTFIAEYEEGYLGWRQVGQHISVIKLAMEHHFFIMNIERDYSTSELYSPDSIMGRWITDPPKHNEYKVFVENLKKSKSCSDFFFGRDKDMGKTIASQPTSSFSIVGGLHHEGIQKFLEKQNKSQFHTIYLTCVKNHTDTHINFSSLRQLYQLYQIPDMLTKTKNAECLEALTERADAALKEDLSKTKPFYVFQKPRRSVKKKFYN